ncbi:MAG: nucleotidyltransferase-like protein [Candidatus Gottesmanbacteria bacterium GW2011_GWB1_49_7]|uniref:Nucleotidyltransferase-like protein n=1 Tax=Candidatus Gottesmanbacteria bacterium GW2011_GWB1_49_7 TaxID=1618448 RepID=A0A0G1YXV0_9BACT|nr:MAG: nucleotidyltransferase-like protein [Candidatus Gottesmanbacteria bacterium GW2011_GWB1_49_7]
MINYTSLHKATYDRFEVQAPKGSKIIFAGVTGSQAYDTADKYSDIDVAGIFLPPKEYIIGLHRVDQLEHKEPGVCDTCIYTLHKFLNLCLSCNPNIIELLFLPDHCIFSCKPQYEYLREHRDLFISKKARWTFAGYAVSQFKRTESHRKWLLDPPTAPPTRKEFNLPENEKLSSDAIGAFNSLVAQRLDDVAQLHELRDQLLASSEVLPGWDSVAQTTLNVEAVHALTGLNKQIVHTVTQEKAYQAAMNRWKSYLNWKASRNPRRAALEEKYGYDTKHASHLIRLILEGEEILRTGHITLPLPQSDLLKEIKAGGWTYDRLKEEVVEIDQRFDEWYKASLLPKGPNIEGVNNLCTKIVQEWIW